MVGDAVGSKVSVAIVGDAVVGNRVGDPVTFTADVVGAGVVGDPDGDAVAFVGVGAVGDSVCGAFLVEFVGDAVGASVSVEFVGDSTSGGNWEEKSLKMSTVS